MMDFLIVLSIGYLFGNFQTSYLLGKWIYKLDVRALGRGNAGASNATESLGFKFGVLVGVLDILKAIVSIWMIKVMFNVGFDSSGSMLLYLNGLGVILGHNFPFFMKFKGGKGTASLVGMMLGLNPFFGLGGMLILLITSLVFDYIAIGTFALVVYTIIVTVLMDAGSGPIAISVIIAFMSTFLHRKNYIRILRKEESKVSRVLGKLKKGKK
ncbi:MAG TPA: glycerol-3-phosphate acyltransferase 1 [Clostridiales bacterium UBA8960]|jgi:glycerol-3-phosphate acyltransferase PlsY|nr:glycerol-3-phosphate acyltransferase 1 [Clostridiales bacterium UBA8960]